MAIDPSIPLRVNPVQFDSPVQSAGQVLQLKGLLQKTQANDAAARRQGTLRDLLSRNDPNLQQQLQSGGFLDEAGQIGKQRAQRAQTEAESRKAARESLVRFAKIVDASGGDPNVYQWAKADLLASETRPDHRPGLEKMLSKFPQTADQSPDFKNFINSILAMDQSTDSVISDQRNREEFQSPAQDSQSVQNN